MPEKKENKNDSDIKVKQPTDVSVNITYTNDEAVHNGSVTSSSFTEDGNELDSFICGTIHDSIGQLLEDCGIESYDFRFCRSRINKTKSLYWII